MKVTINGIRYDIPAGKSLLRYLRDDLHLTSVKDGCSVGACGTCTVLINGVATKSCIRKTENLEGAEVVTIEGLSDREREIYVRAFGEAGAVQCGFCIPGMVLCAKGLLDVNPAPTRDEVKKAINGNICRCTGYVRIEEAILLAAKYLRVDDVISDRGIFSIPSASSIAPSGPAFIAGPIAEELDPDLSSSGLTGGSTEELDPAINAGTGWVVTGTDVVAAGTKNLEYGERPDASTPAGISADVPRPDVREKVLGTGIFGDDIALEGMIYAKALRSPTPRALIHSINVEKAEQHPDCVRILTAKDVPNNKIGHIKQDWDVMIAAGQETRYIGDALALVGATRAESLDAIIKLIELDCEELPPVTSPTAALLPDAPQLHEGGNVMSQEHLHLGDPDAAIASAAHVVTRSYKTPHNDHAFMEPECAVAVPEGENGLHLYTGGQSVYDDRRETANMLQIPLEQVRVTSNLVGGGFGGKEDMSVQHHAALMAWYTKRPVKVKFSRQESIDYHTKRHAMEMEFTTACDAEGHLLAMKATLLADTGAYASLGGPVLQRACTHAAGPYNFQNVDIIGRAVYTNNVVSGAYRGFGVTQSCFAMENNLNLLAELVGISAWEIRYRNAIRPGQVLPNGQIADPNTAMVETLEAVRKVYESSPRAGIACGFKNSGKGVGLTDTGRCLLSVEQGKVHIRTSAACMGQGIAAVCAQMVSEATGLPPELIVHETPDTVRTPDSGTSTASRQTVLTGEATRRAAAELAEALQSVIASAESAKQPVIASAASAKQPSHAAATPETEYAATTPKIVVATTPSVLTALEGQEFYGEFSPVTDPMGAAVPNPVSHVSYSYATQVVVLDGQGKLEKVVAAYDVGRPVNPGSCAGQIEGGVVMGLGFALTEDFPIENGRPKVRYGTLGLPRATQVPPIEVLFTQIDDDRLLPYAYGAKGVGELCLIPTSPACAHAYYRYDGVFRNSLPLRDTFYRK
jgi:CO/xanthine dehydrogenase Mo-binding subunit/aerobic-type carbon monoxide dehydrogenase small subunit (CoxS/CutS family)